MPRVEYSDFTEEKLIRIADSYGFEIMKWACETLDASGGHEGHA